MSRDELFASAAPALSPRPHRDGRGSVVIPLPIPALDARRALPRPRAAGTAPAPHASVAQIGDYQAPRPAAPRAAARPTPIGVDATPSSRLAGHAGELDQVLCQHVEVQLELIARHAPELAQPVETVLRSLDLLLKLRRR